MEQISTKDLTFEVGGQTTRAYLAIPEHGSGPGVVVLHAWWGLTAFFQELCDRLAAAGYVAFAPDLLQSKTAATIEEAERNMAAADGATTRAVVLNAIPQLRANADIKGSAIGVVGFSMGASWALQLAAAAPDDVAAVTLFYGADLVDVSAARAAFLGHFAEHDEWEPTENVRQMEASIRAAGRDVTIYTYSEASHWFVERDRPDAFNPGAAQLAWDRTLAFLADQLRSPEHDR